MRRRRIILAAAIVVVVLAAAFATWAVIYTHSSHQTTTKPPCNFPILSAPSDLPSSQLSVRGWKPADPFNNQDLASAALSPLIVGLTGQRNPTLAALLGATRQVQLCYAAVVAAPELREWVNPSTANVILYTAPAYPGAGWQNDGNVMLMKVHPPGSDLAAFVTIRGVTAAYISEVRNLLTLQITAVGRFVSLVSTVDPIAPPGQVAFVAGWVGYDSA